MIRLRWDQCCTRKGCLRPSSELGGLCTRHWMGLTAQERDTLRWEAWVDEQLPELADEITVSFDPVIDAKVLQRWYDQPSYEPPAA